MVSHRSISTTAPDRLQPVPNPEVRPVLERRVFSPAEKLRILAEADRYRPGSPERGALVRREGIYSSHLSKWRQQRDRGFLDGVTAVPRGPKPAPRDPLAEEVARLQRENARLQQRLTQAEAIITAQKKLAIALGIGEEPTLSERT